MIYFDISALVKRYIREKGSKAIQHIFNQRDILVVTAKVTYVEALAAFARRKREGYISMEKGTVLFLFLHPFYNRSPSQ
jgi:predicted nucleic acid-binding protein